MDPLFGLFLLFALGGRRGGGGGGGTPYPLPGGGASTFPITPPVRVPAPIPSGTKWKPYAPLNQAVIARAQSLLRDSRMVVNQEVIEPDPAGSGQVRYLKVASPPGKISVTAWKPNLAQLPPPTTM